MSVINFAAKMKCSINTPTTGGLEEDDDLDSPGEKMPWTGRVWRDLDANLCLQGT
jgi:hypothetical protein